MKTWDTPPIIKVYEALGAVIDGRIELEGDAAKVYSSSGNKYYDVSYDPVERSIMMNDNGSYWKGYLGYPAIAFLFKIGELEYREDLAEVFKDVAWKDINVKFKNDFDKTIEFIFESISSQERIEIEEYAQGLLNKIKAEPFNYLGKKIKPPTGY